jgi:hypothetical protein
VCVYPLRIGEVVHTVGLLAARTPIPSMAYVLHSLVAFGFGSFGTFEHRFSGCYLKIDTSKLSTNIHFKGVFF